ncbi:MAG TPA: hypothetical protein VFH02_06755 [Jiangellaceae bacterium]|nr:hypothetical protein [Jiangellaceae bacterium]
MVCGCQAPSYSWNGVPDPAQCLDGRQGPEGEPADLADQRQKLGDAVASGGGTAGGRGRRLPAGISGGTGLEVFSIRTGAVGVATIAAVLVLMAACAYSDVRIIDVTGELSSRLLGLGINTCNADLWADVEQTAEEVRVRVHAENNTTAACRDVMRVALDDALGNRRVIDDRTGEVLRVRPPD